MKTLTQSDPAQGSITLTEHCGLPPDALGKHLKAQERAGGPETLAMKPWLDQSCRATIRQAKEALESLSTDNAVNGFGDYGKGLLCGVEDRDLQGDGYGAMLYGYARALERVHEVTDPVLTALNSLLAGEGEAKLSESDADQLACYRAHLREKIYVDATPDEGLPVRILEAHIDETETVSMPSFMGEQMTIWAKERNAILRQAVAQLSLPPPSKPTDKEMLDWLAEQIGPGYAGGIVTVANLIPELGGDFCSAIRAAMSGTQEKGGRS